MGRHVLMSALVFGLAEWLTVPASAQTQNPYFSLTYNTAQGTATMRIAGDFGVVRDTQALTTYMLRVLRWSGVDISTRVTITGPLTMVGASTMTVAGSAFSVGGSTLVVIGGSVGISTRTPAGKLAVNTGTDENILIKSNSADASFQWVNDANSAYNAGRIYANPLLINPGGDGNVGIGTTTPGSVLDIRGASAASPAASGTTPNSIARVVATSNGTLEIGMKTTNPWSTWLQVNDNGDFSVEYPLVLNPNGGNVGVGTLTPATIFDVEGAAQFGTAPTKSTFSATGQLTLDSNASLQIGTTFYVGNGRVGIGTTSPADTLHIQGSVLRLQRTGQVEFIMNNGTTEWEIYQTAGSSDLRIYGATGERILIQADGDVGIGTTAPVTKLDVAGSAQFGNSAAKSTFTATTGFMALVSSETITAGAVITANACGGVKIVYAATAVVTDTVNTFTAPAAANTGCCMRVVADRASANITLDANANFDSAAAGDVVLTAKDSVEVCQVGTYWAQTSALLAN